jgi:hypothetical protein
VLRRLQEKRRRSRGVFDEFPREVIDDPQTLPPLKCRIVFRDVVRATDRRTMKACLAPPCVFAIHKAPQIIWARGSETDVVYLLALLNSLPLDWFIRRRVETTMSFGLLNSLPIPEGGRHRARIAHLGARLSCVDERYANFAMDVDVEPGLLPYEDRLDMEAEIDGLVAHTYGLEREHLDVIFADFVEAAVPASYRERVVRHYEGATR